MKFTCAALILLFPMFSRAQTGDKGTWKLGAQFTTDIYFANDYYPATGILPGGCYDPQPGTYYFSNRFYWTSGITAQYALTDHLELGSGISYSVKERYAPYYYCVLEGGIYPAVISFTKISAEYIEVPVLVRYNFFNSGLRAHVEAGVLTGYEVFTGASPEDRFLLSGSGGIGMNYTIGKRVNIGLTTSYKRKLTDFRRYTSYSSKNCMSVELKTTYIFGK